jgi:hypothetical protein
MPTTFANTIDGNDIYAKRAECDAAGNDLSTTYATKSEIPGSSQLVPSATVSDANKVLTVDSNGTPGWAASQGLFVAIYGTSTYAEVHAAVEAGKIVYCSVSGGAGGGAGAGHMAFLAYRNPGWNYEFQYYRSNGDSSGNDSVFVYKLNSTNTWETTERTVKAGNISYPVTTVNVNGSSAMTGTVANITVQEVPAVTSSDNNKVLKASYSGGVASYSWQNESGGGGGGSYTAGTGIDITNDVISVDTSVVATQTDLADKEDAFTVGTGLEMDTTGGVNTLQVETPMDIVAGPGISIDNPDSDTLRVSVGTTFTQAQLDYLKAALGLDETVLYESTAGMQLHNGLQLPETLYNFERIRFYVASTTSNGTPVSVEVPIQVAPYPNGTIELFFTNGHDLPSNFKLSWKWKMTLSGTTLTLTLAQYWGQNGTSWTQGDNLNDSTVFKIVGIHRIANN